MVRLPVGLLTLVALAACSGNFDERVHEQFHEMISTGKTTLLTVENVAGSVRVEGWPKPAVDVQATKYGYDADQVRSIAIDVDARQTGAIAVRTRYARGVHGGGVRYVIHAPSFASIKASNTAGSVDVTGVQGNIAVETQAGEITVDAGTVAGARSIDLHATTGAITLYITPQSSATVQASSTIGDFSSDFRGVTVKRENLVGARGGGAIGGGSAHILLTTTTGAIALSRR